MDAVPNRESRTAVQLAATFGERLKTERLNRNLSQAALAERAGVSRNTVARFEAGHGGALDSVARLALALPINDLIAALATPPARRPEAEDRERARAASLREPRAPFRWGDER